MIELTQREKEIIMLGLIMIETDCRVGELDEEVVEELGKEAHTDELKALMNKMRCNDY